jgi:hypothetical protein
MVETIKTVLGTLLLLFQSRSRLHVEILVLRHQLVVLRRTAPKRVRLRVVDRLLFVLLYRLWPGVLNSIAVVMRIPMKSPGRSEMMAPVDSDMMSPRA